MPLFLSRYLPHLLAAATLVLCLFAGYRWAYGRGHDAATALCARQQAEAYSAQQRAAREAQAALQASYDNALALSREGQDRAARAAADWRRRYEDAISRDPGCQAWAAAAVGCPVPGGVQ